MGGGKLQYHWKRMVYVRPFNSKDNANTFLKPSRFITTKPSTSKNKLGIKTTEEYY